MEKFIYLVATPESLVASHLPPNEFGNYLAVGTKKTLRSQAVFFEADANKCKIQWDYLDKKLVPYKNGEPKRSVYLSIYRVFEKIPLDALKSLYLATDDGKVLELQAGSFKPGPTDEIHLYQQFNPITAMIASKLNPPEFINFLTDTRKPVSTPKLFLAELQLNELATDPTLPIKNLPYRNPDHLRECLIKLHKTNERLTKTVTRYMGAELPFRVIKDGFFIGEKGAFLFYPFPTADELEDKYYSWWRSALV